MACSQLDLLYTGARGAKNTCGKPGWIWLGGLPGLTSSGLSHDGQDVTGWACLGRNYRGTLPKIDQRLPLIPDDSNLPRNFRFRDASNGRDHTMPLDDTRRYESARMYLTSRVETSYNQFL